ncbi:hypothetical protein NEA10_07900 [Phormidium yuhuli AB48]|uniref:Uncharacterized protein n=1 Tax=Phormidium yuhuli AB48 TaxID=2940671 RepID=A0ABY5AV73_9CYAN|nr:hypothetical protein [Phormidium yuhuli]USR92631.1 hypothetical protein NEA10_07900 [Phormidium yuhuli AB48]
MRNAILLGQRFAIAITPVSFWQKAILLGELINGDLERSPQFENTKKSP